MGFTGGSRPPSFRAEILKLIRHIARLFLESDQPDEVAVFRHAMDFLEEVMLSGDTPPLRCLAAILLNRVIYSKLHVPEHNTTGLLAPASLSPKTVFAKWGEPEAHVQHFCDLAANPREPLPIRDLAVTHLVSQRAHMNKNLQLRFHRLVLDILWEAPTSTKWDVKGDYRWRPILLKHCFGIVWWNRHALPSAEYDRFLELIRQALAFPLVKHPPGTTPPPDADIRLYGDHPWPGWYLLKEAFQDEILVGYNRPDLFLRDFPEAFLFYTPRYQYPGPPSDTTEELERLLLDLVRSPADLALLWEARHWARQQWHDLYWGRYLLRAQAKFPPTESVPTLVAALQTAPPEERHQAVLKLGALAHTGTLPDPTGVLAALATAVQDADFWVRLLAVEGLRGFATASLYPLAPLLSVLRALQTAVLHDPEEVIQRVAMETLCAVVTTATLPDPPPVVTTLLEITAAQARIIAKPSYAYDPSWEDPVPRWIRKAGDQALLTYIKRLESPTPLFHMLQSENEEIRAGVAWALGQLGDARAVPPLSKPSKMKANGCERTRPTHWAH
ncbi:MAG: HEAT repeat domain-containing protein [Candidatus Heimdallarchaeota archaeon]